MAVHLAAVAAAAVAVVGNGYMVGQVSQIRFVLHKRFDTINTIQIGERRNLCNLNKQ